MKDIGKKIPDSSVDFKFVTPTSDSGRESASIPLSIKRDFGEAFQNIEKTRGTRDFTAMTNDIVYAINDWNSKNTEELRSHYPNWRYRDFIKLLDELKVKYFKPSEEEIKEIEQKELFQLKNDLLRMKDELAQLIRYEDSGPIKVDTMDEKMNRLVTSLRNEKNKLKGFSIISRILDRGSITTTRIKEDIIDIKKSIEELKKQMADETPEEAEFKRQEEIKKIEQNRQVKKEKKDRIKNKIVEMELMIVELERELK